MKNIGPVTIRWLAATGIHTVDDLRGIGILNAYNLVRSHGCNANLNLLWALQGVIMNLHWTRIPLRIKQDLRQRLEEQPCANPPPIRGC